MKLKIIFRIMAGFIVSLVGIAKPCAQPQPVPGTSTNWQQTVNYTIRVTLNTTMHTLDGRVHMHYINASPDTLYEIWVHLWPNAYKTDQTAFANQQLLTGKLDFYFSKPAEKGYINQLDFISEAQRLRTEDHPEHLDIIKVILHKPLLPGAAATIETPFHVQLPKRFSRMGYQGNHYSITQWFPKIAVYDARGWHAMPYLELGEYYADFGSYDVSITLPDNFKVAATGQLQTLSEKAWLLQQAQQATSITRTNSKLKSNSAKPRAPKKPADIPASNKTLHFLAENVIDFAWFACPDWQVKYVDTVLQGKQLEVWNFVLPGDEQIWQQSLENTLSSVAHYSSEVGPYPYPQITVAGDPAEYGSGMEYPMVTTLNTADASSELLYRLILHETGHNWFQAALANNERLHPWLDEGLNSYIERKAIRKNSPQQGTLLMNDDWLLSAMAGIHADQPIATPADKLETINYSAVAYNKTALWLESIEQKVGTAAMQDAFRAYYRAGLFKKVDPEMLKDVLEKYTGMSMDTAWQALHQTGSVGLNQGLPVFWPVDIAKGMAARKPKKAGIAPAIGVNAYDKLQLGLLLHNYRVPYPPFKWVMSPMYATGSKTVTGYGRAGYTWYPRHGVWKEIELFTSAARFTTQQGTDQNGAKVFAGFTKFMPGIYLEHKRKNATATQYRYLELKSWIIQEGSLATQTPPPPGDTIFYRVKGPGKTTVIPQLTLGWNNDRALYPYRIKATAQQVQDLLRLTAEAEYFYNYDASGKGILLRAFAGKIWYLTPKTDEVRIQNSRYHFSMYGPNGQQDYTYSTPFHDRNQSTGWGGRQIMMRDGFFKYRSDYSAVRPGLSNEGLDFFDNWILALNLTLDIPDKINPLSVLPFDVPLKIFADIGTSASPWRPESPQEKFLYSIGLHLPVCKVIQVYLPLIDSRAFTEPNQVNNPNRPGGPLWWQEKVTFALDFNVLKPKLLANRFIR